MPAQPRGDFIYRAGGEPHASRREAIRAAHPEVSRLMGPEPLTKYIVVAVMAAHLATTYLAKDLPLPWFVAATYVVSGTFQANLFLAIHEISHNLAFRDLRCNRLLAMLCNLPLLVPYAYAFKPYHMAHHRYQGDHGVDTDIPTALEARLTTTRLGKAAWLCLQLFAYALRPCLLKPGLLACDRWSALNWALCLAFDLAALRVWGPWALVYLLAGMVWAASFHPTAGHFLAEHYVLEAEGADGPAGCPETFSYYGPLNAVAWNVGYHNEHHDFPGVPWSRLPQLRRLAPEFYDRLPQTASWPGTTLRYLLGPASGFHRVKRRSASPD